MPDHPSPREIGAGTMRARFILEAAGAMTAHPDEPYGEPELSLKGKDGARVALSASSTIDGIGRVVSGEIDLAFINPSSALTVAYRGKGSRFSAPQPVRAVTVLPSRDQCLFAVHPATGLSSVEDIGRARYPLKLGLRGREEHWLHAMLEDIFNAAGFSLADIVAWGGEVHKTGHIPRPHTDKFKALARGELTAAFDEGVHGWADAVAPAGLRVLKLEDETLGRLEALGYRRDVLARSRYPSLPDDIPTLDFSGWPVFVRQDAADDLVRRFCAGLEARRDVIRWEGPGPLPLERMCGNSPEAPLGIPLHPAAERYWKDRGYL